MVKITIKPFFICLALCFFPFLLCSTQEVKISAEVEHNEAVENQPVKGALQVTHSNKDKVDPAHFKIEGKPLKVEFVKDVKIGEEESLIVSIYTFELPPVPKGLHLLPAITLSIGGSTYESIPSTYSVEGERNARPAPQRRPAPAPSIQNAASDQAASPSSSAGEVKPYLKLEAKVEGSQPIYPGQRLKLVYKYLFEGDIELTKEDLPLLQAEGFKKIGQKEISDKAEGNISVREITQIVEAVKPGTYPMGPSVVEGRSFLTDSSGRRQYISDINSVAPILQIKVLPFPLEGKPISFNGAVGEFTFSAAMQTPAEVRVGDKISLLLEIKGKTSDWNNVKLPDMCCQPGFSGLFKLSDLPPAGQVKNNGKEFILEVRPLTDAVKAVPSIEFSYFDLEKKGYVKLKSPPIPIHVLPETTQALQQNAPSANTQEIPKTELEKLNLAAPIEIQRNFTLTSSDLSNLSFSDAWVFLLIPFGIGILYLQMRLKESMIESLSLAKTKTSQEIFSEAKEQFAIPSAFYQLMHQAFFTRLAEMGEIPSAETSLQELPFEGPAGKVRSFLTHVDELRFAGREKVDQKEVAARAESLFNELQDE